MNGRDLADHLIHFAGLAEDDRREPATWQGDNGGRAYGVHTLGREPQVLRRTEPIHNLPDPEFIAELRRLNGTPQQVYNEPELLALLLPLLRHDFSLVDDYCYSEEPPLDMPISVFGGTEDDEVTMDELKAWKSHSNGKFRLRMLPGDHFFLNTLQPFILRAICQDLLPVLD